MFREQVWVKIKNCPSESLLNRIMSHEDKMIKAGYPPVIKLAFNEGII